MIGGTRPGKELRDELYDGSMLARFINPRSGKTETISPHSWACEGASSWLEQGELVTEVDFGPLRDLLSRTYPERGVEYPRLPSLPRRDGRSPFS